MWEPPDPANDDLHGASVVLDTNVIIELISWHDVLDAFAKGGFAPTPKLTFKATRVAASLILYEHLHQQRLRTFSLRREPLEIVECKAPSAVKNWRSVYVAFAINHLMTFFSGWQNVEADGDPQDEPVGDDADDALIEIARRYNLPLVSHEGLKENGTLNRKRGMYKKANDVGVRVVHPAKYWDGSIDVPMARTRILSAFDDWKVNFIAKHSDEHGMVQAIPVFSDHLRFVLKHV